MTMAVTEGKLATYLAGTLKAVLEAGNYIVVHYGSDKDMIERSTNPDGTINADQLYRNVSRVVDCSVYDADRLYEMMNRDRISATLLCLVEKGADGKNRLRCHAAIDSREKERIDEVIRALNKIPEYGEKSKEQLAEYCVRNRMDAISMKNVPEHVYEEMRRSSMPETVYCVDRNHDGTVDVKVPVAYQDQLMDAYRNAMLVCSGHTWDTLEEQQEADGHSYSSAVSATLDSKKTCIIVNPDNPSLYIRTDSEGLHLYAHTKNGEIECNGDSVRRINSTDYEQQAYTLVRMIKGGRNDVEIITPADHNAEQRLEQLRQQAPVKREASMDDKIIYYKRALSRHVIEALNQDAMNREHTNQLRMKDDMERLNSARDHDVMTGNDAQKGDRDSDRALLSRAIAGGIPETAKDLSDLPADEFAKEFCDQKLGTRGLDGEERSAYLETVPGTETCVERLAAEPPAIRMAVVNDLDESIREIQQIDEPEMERMTARELEEERTRSEEEILR